MCKSCQVEIHILCGGGGGVYCFYVGRTYYACDQFEKEDTDAPLLSFS